MAELIDKLDSRTNNKGAIHQPANIPFENVITSTPYSKLKKDIRYSLEVWVSADRETIKRVFEAPVYCTCKMPDTRTLYVICDVCSMEYHPECIGLDAQLTNSMPFVSQNCKTNILQ